MHLPTPQFSRLVTVLAFDLSNPSLDSMILAWDHIATRYLNRLATHRALAGKVESVRLLAIHDAVHAVFGSDTGYIFRGSSSGSSLSAALAATARASHDILTSVFDSPEDLADLAHSLEESLSLISDYREKAAGSATGAASAGTYSRTFAPLSLRSQLVETHEPVNYLRRHEISSGPSRFFPNPRSQGEWRRSA